LDYKHISHNLARKAGKAEAITKQKIEEKLSCRRIKMLIFKSKKLIQQQLLF